MARDDGQIARRIEEAIGVLFKPGQLVEVRVRLVTGHWRGLYFTDHLRMGSIVHNLDDDQRVQSIYYVFNRINHRLIELRAPCKCERCERGGLIVANPTDEHIDQILNGPSQHLTSNEDIDNLNWLFVDVDTSRAAGKEHESATSAEKKASRAVAHDIIRFLNTLQWPEPVIADSGNGFHILPRINLPNSAANISLLQDCLKALAAWFNCGACRIDDGVFNAARLTRAYGTTTRKGVHTDERPYRRNRLLMPQGIVRSVFLDQILALASEAPAPALEKGKRAAGYPSLHEDFDPGDFFKWYEEQGAFSITGRREWQGHQIMVTDHCIISGAKHTGSTLTGFIVGDNLGYHCWSPECKNPSVGEVIKKLNQEYAPYPRRIWIEQEIDWSGVNAADVEELPEIKESLPPVSDQNGAARKDLAQTSANLATSSVPEPPQGGDENDKDFRPPLPKAGPPDLKQNWLYSLVAVIFRDPKAAHKDFVLWRRQLQTVVEQAMISPQRLALLEVVLKFEENQQPRALPGRTELQDYCKSKPELLAQIGEIGAAPDDLTLDYCVNKILDLAELADEKRTARKHLGMLESGKSVSQVRKYVKERWLAGTLQTTVRGTGESVQERADQIVARFEQYMRQTGEKSPMAFDSGFPTIDRTIISEDERCFAVIGPPNNYKTSVLLTVAKTLANQGKPVMLVTGEHEVVRLEDRLAMLHVYNNRAKYGMTCSYKAWRDGHATEEDLRKFKVAMENWKQLISCPGPIDIHHANEFNNELDSILDYMHSKQRKYGYKALVIDPFDALLLNTESSQRFFKGQALIQRLFDLKTSYSGGSGLIVLTSFQMKKEVKAAVENLQNDSDATLADFEGVLDASNIAIHSAAIEKFDMLWGVAGRFKNGSKGIVTCARTRHGREFSPFWFSVDANTHWISEKDQSGYRGMFDAVPAQENSIRLEPHEVL